ncbi:MAG: peptidoglycan-binding domain-containing protein [Gemmobacter sp.]
MILRAATSLLLLISLAACQPKSPMVKPPQKVDLLAGVIVEGAAPVPEPAKGECWESRSANLIPPGRTPSADAPTTPGKIHFRVPCPEVMTPEFLASLQRALQARGFFRGAVTGTMDAPTQQAVRDYQQSLGLDLPILTLAAAQSLGLVPVAREEL